MREVAIRLDERRSQEFRRLLGASLLLHLVVVLALLFSPSGPSVAPPLGIRVQLVAPPAAVARPTPAAPKPAPARPKPKPKPPKPAPVVLPTEPSTPKPEPKVEPKPEPTPKPPEPKIEPKPPEPVAQAPQPPEEFDIEDLREELGEPAPEAAPGPVLAQAGPIGSPDGSPVSPEVAKWLRDAQAHVWRNSVVPPNFEMQSLVDEGVGRSRCGGKCARRALRRRPLRQSLVRRRCGQLHQEGESHAGAPEGRALDVRIPLGSRLMRRHVLFVYLAGLVLCVGAPATAQDRPAVVVKGGQGRSFKVAVQDFLDESALPKPGRPMKFREYIEKALEFSGAVSPMSHAAFLGPETSGPLDGGPQIVCSDWSQIGADALVEGTLSVETELVVEYRIWDATRCTRLARKRYRQPATADPALIGRRIADDIVASFVGVRGVSASEITFVSTRGGNGEIYVVGAEGSNPRRATNNGSINAFPSWTPEGDGIVYTSYRHRDTPRLFLSSRGRGRPGRLLRKPAGRLRRIPWGLLARWQELARGAERAGGRFGHLPGDARGVEGDGAVPEPGHRDRADLVTGRPAHRLRLGPHRSATRLHHERRWLQAAPHHVPGQLQLTPRLVAGRPLDRLRDPDWRPVRYLAHRPRGNGEPAAGPAPPQRRDAELGAELAQTGFQLPAPGPGRPLRDRRERGESAPDHPGSRGEYEPFVGPIPALSYRAARGGEGSCKSRESLGSG